MKQRFTGVKSIVRPVLTLVMVTFLAGCTAQFRNHGYVPTDDGLAEILVGVDTKESVAQSIGRPTSAGLLESSGWYYVQSRWRHFAWKAPVEIDRQVLSVSFDEDQVVTNIERFGLEDGRVVVLSRRVTDTNIKGVSFLRQLLGNIGNFTADQFLN